VLTWRELLVEENAIGKIHVDREKNEDLPLIARLVWRSGTATTRRLLVNGGHRLVPAGS